MRTHLYPYAAGLIAFLSVGYVLSYVLPTVVAMVVGFLVAPLVVKHLRDWLYSLDE